MKKWLPKLRPILRADESFYKKGIEKLEKSWNEFITLEGNYVKGVSSSVVHKKGGFLGFFLNMKTARETNDYLRIFEHIFIQQ